jgi:predicted small integral membrane protein
MAIGARRGRLSTLGGLPVAATVLTGIVALYMVLVTFGNITDSGTNHEFVRRVLAMDTTFQSAAIMWRAITSPTLQNIAYVLVILWELATSVVLLVATLALIGSRAKGDYGQARQLASLGFLMVILLFGGGFIVIGGEWFAMWQSSAWNGLEPAFQNVVIAGIGLLLVHLPSPQWGQIDVARPT